MFTSMMVRSWYVHRQLKTRCFLTFYCRSSATNCAHVYNEGLKRDKIAAELPAAYSKQLVLDTETVWNSLFLYWLIDDAVERGVSLQLRHDAPQNARLRDALEARNMRMVGPGQDAWNHTCDLCCWVNDEPDGTQSK